MATFEEVDACLKYLNGQISQYAPLLGGQFKEEFRLKLINGILGVAEGVRRDLAVEEAKVRTFSTKSEPETP